MEVLPALASHGAAQGVASHDVTGDLYRLAFVGSVRSGLDPHFAANALCGVEAELQCLQQPELRQVSVIDVVEGHAGPIALDGACGVLDHHESCHEAGGVPFAESRRACRPAGLLAQAEDFFCPRGVSKLAEDGVQADDQSPQRGVAPPIIVTAGRQRGHDGGVRSQKEVIDLMPSAGKLGHRLPNFGRCPVSRRLFPGADRGLSEVDQTGRELPDG